MGLVLAGLLHFTLTLLDSLHALALLHLDVPARSLPLPRNVLGHIGHTLFLRTGHGVVASPSDACASSTSLAKKLAAPAPLEIIFAEAERRHVTRGGARRVLPPEFSQPTVATMLGRLMQQTPGAMRQAPRTISARGLATSVARMEADVPAVRTRVRGAFQRPRLQRNEAVTSVTSPIAQPKTPPEVLEHGVEQSPNFATIWSPSQRPKSEAYRGPRFEQMDQDVQPNSLSAMELIANHPIQYTHKRVAACDGGVGPLGHPRVYINLDKPGPKACPYCGIRYEQERHEH